MSDTAVGMSNPRRLEQLNGTEQGSPMGELLRRFWHPVALADSVKPGNARPLRILSEDLTLYRGESGTPHLVAGHCPHRRTLLHTGWVQGEELRCIYHGWKFNSAGKCTEAPAEGEAVTSKVRIPAYPIREYCGLLFAYMGPGAPPEFNLPRKAVFEREGGMAIPRVQDWPCHWFAHVENSLDAVHVSFVHQAGKVGEFGKAITSAIPKLEYFETDAGIRQIATRSPTNVRISDWTFPNNNHILVPGLPGDPWIDIGIWMTPIDNERTARFLIYSLPDGAEAHERFRAYFQKFASYNPAEHHDDLLLRKIYPEEPILQLTGAQDYVATMGQGVRPDRSLERLGKSDAGIVFLRRLFLREMAALANNEPKKWKRLDHGIELPKPQNLRNA